MSKFIHHETITREWFGEEDGYDVIETDDGFNVYQNSMHLGCFDDLNEACKYAEEQADKDDREREIRLRTREGKPINEARADRARKALAGGDYDCIHDLLTDLMHLCEMDREVYFPEAYRDAQDQFKNESGPGDDIEQDARRLFAETGTL